MLKNIRGSIMAVEVLPEYETETEQEIDIYLESGPTIEMLVTSEETKILKERIGKIANFEISDVTMCGVHARAVDFKFE